MSHKPPGGPFVPGFIAIVAFLLLLGGTLWWRGNFATEQRRQRGNDGRPTESVLQQQMREGSLRGE